MKQLLTFLLLLACSFSFAQKKNKPANDPFAGLDTAFQRVLKDRKAAGFAVAVVSKDKVLYAKGFGYRDYENNYLLLRILYLQLVPAPKHSPHR